MVMNTVETGKQVVVMHLFKKGVRYELPNAGITIEEGDTSGDCMKKCAGITIGNTSILLVDNCVKAVVFVCKVGHEYRSVII